MIGEDGEERSVFWIGIVLHFSCQSSKPDSTVIRYISLQYMEYISALAEVDKEMGYVCPRLRAANEADQSAVEKIELNK